MPAKEESCRWFSSFVEVISIRQSTVISLCQLFSPICIPNSKAAPRCLCFTRIPTLLFIPHQWDGIPISTVWPRRELDRLLAEQQQKQQKPAAGKEGADPKLRRAKPVKPEDIRPVHGPLRMDAEGRAVGAAGSHVQFDDDWVDGWPLAFHYACPLPLSALRLPYLVSVFMLRVQTLMKIGPFFWNWSAV